MHVKKKTNTIFFFGELHRWNRRKTTESTHALYPVPGYFSTGLVLIKLNTHCYAVNKRTVILRNNKQDNALLLFLINFLHEHIYRTQNMCQVSYHSTPDLNLKKKIIKRILYSYRMNLLYITVIKSTYNPYVPVKILTK